MKLCCKILLPEKITSIAANYIGANYISNIPVTKCSILTVIRVFKLIACCNTFKEVVDNITLCNTVYGDIKIKITKIISCDLPVC